MSTRYVGSNTIGATTYGTGVSVSPPSGLSQGEAWIVIVGVDQTGVSWTTPSGWTAAGVTVGNFPGVGAFLKIAGASEGVQVFTTSASPGAGAGVCGISIRGNQNHPTTLLDGVANFFDATNGNTIDGPSITQADANSMGLSVMAFNSATTTATAPNNMTDTGAVSTDGLAITMRAAYSHRIGSIPFDPGPWSFPANRTQRSAKTIGIASDGTADAVTESWMKFPKPKMVK